MANQWFKFYGGDYLADPKMAALTPQERSCWLTILCLASMSTTQGEIGFLTVEVLLSKSGIDFDPYNPEEWNNNLGVLKKFESMKMLKLKDDGSISVRNWEKRQEHNLTVAERVAKSRLNKKNVTTNVTNVTSEENRIEENREIPAKADLRISYSEESEKENPRAKTTKPKNRAALALRQKCYRLIEKEYGVAPTTHFADYDRVLDAQKVLKESDIINIVEDALAVGKKRTLREMLTAREVDTYRQGL